MFLFSLSWSQGWVSFTCKDSCSETLRLLYVFNCACFSYILLEIVSSTTLAAIDLHGFCISNVSVGRNSYQVPDVSLPSTKVLSHPEVSCQVGCPPHICVGAHCSGCLYPKTPLYPMMFLELLLHSVWWSLDFSLSLKMAYFQISILDSKFIPDLYHTSLSIPLSRYMISTVIFLMFWMVWQNPF